MRKASRPRVLAPLSFLPTNFMGRIRCPSILCTLEFEMKATIRKPDGTVIEFEGTAEEYRAAFEPPFAFTLPKAEPVYAPYVQPSPFPAPFFPQPAWPADGTYIITCQGDNKFPL